MGAWGYRSFENDAALDWIDALDADLGLVRTAITVDVGNSVDECEALAAAEIIALLIDSPRRGAPQGVKAFLSRCREMPTDTDVDSARIVVAHIIEQGELVELWEHNPAWMADTVELLAALGGSLPTATRPSAPTPQIIIDVADCMGRLAQMWGLGTPKHTVDKQIMVLRGLVATVHPGDICAIRVDHDRLVVVHRTGEVGCTQMSRGDACRRTGRLAAKLLDVHLQ